MRVYADASAVVAAVIREPATGAVVEATSGVAIATSRLTYVEVRSALARARRLRRITGRVAESARRELDGWWPEFSVAELAEPVVEAASELLDVHDLRSHDAVQLASALLLETDVLVCLDARLRRAATREGLAVAP